MGPVGRLERLPKWLNLVPMVAQWAWLSLRYRSITLPSCANPAIVTGGMVGEGKLEYFDVMGPAAASFVAATTSVIARGAASLPEAEAAMALAGLAYPVVVKPDLGWCGFGVRRIDGRAELCAYLDAYPAGERIVIQEWLDDAGEAGIFYMRHPAHDSGQVIGILLRHYPRVVGDGRQTIAQLIAADPRASRLGRDGASEPCCDPGHVPAAGHTVRIATVGSTRVGGMYEDGSTSITPELTAAIDAIAKDMKDFYVGRFDVKYSNIAALAAGTGFKIMEVNGAGSEAVHAWDPSLTLRQAYAIVFAKQRRLFAIGDEMRRRGHAPVGWLALARHHLRQQALIKRYPRSN
ncbi:MAG: hypothetical protein JWQ07_423 [Ramlibacter sp.]|nr:hypothetical protein [Ramlibacter sp.]